MRYSIVLSGLLFSGFAFADDSLSIISVEAPEGDGFVQRLALPRASLKKNAPSQSGTKYVTVTLEAQTAKHQWYEPRWLIKRKVSAIPIEITSAAGTKGMIVVYDNKGQGVVVQPGDDGQDIVKDSASEKEKDGALKLTLPIVTIPVDDQGVSISVGYTEIMEGLGPLMLDIFLNAAKVWGSDHLDGAAESVIDQAKAMVELLKQQQQTLDHPLLLLPPGRCAATPATCGGSLETRMLAVVQISEVDKLLKDYVVGNGVMQKRESKEAYDQFVLYVHVEVSNLPDNTLSYACRAALDQDLLHPHTKLSEVCPSSEFAATHQTRFDRLRDAADNLDPALADDERGARIAELAETYEDVCGAEDFQLPTTSAPCRAVARTLERADIRELRERGRALRELLKDHDRLAAMPKEGMGLCDYAVHYGQQLDASLQTFATKVPGCQYDGTNLEHPLLCGDQKYVSKLADEMMAGWTARIDGCIAANLKAADPGDITGPLGKMVLEASAALDPKDWPPSELRFDTTPIVEFLKDKPRTDRAPVFVDDTVSTTLNELGSIGVGQTGLPLTPRWRALEDVARKQLAAISRSLDGAWELSEWFTRGEARALKASSKEADELVKMGGQMLTSADLNRLKERVVEANNAICPFANLFEGGINTFVVRSGAPAAVYQQDNDKALELRDAVQRMKDHLSPPVDQGDPVNTSVPGPNKAREFPAS